MAGQDPREIGDRHGRDHLQLRGIQQLQDRIAGRRIHEIPGIVHPLRDHPGKRRVHDRPGGQRDCGIDGAFCLIEIGLRFRLLPFGVLNLPGRRDALLDEPGQPREARFGGFDARRRLRDRRALGAKVRRQTGHVESHEDVAGLDDVALGFRHLGDTSWPRRHHGQLCPRRRHDCAGRNRFLQGVNPRLFDRDGDGGGGLHLLDRWFAAGDEAGGQAEDSDSGAHQGFLLCGVTRPVI